jgi:hypothetical protein
VKKPVTASSLTGTVKPKKATGRPRPKKKSAKPAKPAHASAHVRAQHHATAVKAAKTRAANAKKAKAHPRRKLALAEGVACCSAEALAASLRLAGHAVTDADVLALYWHTARDEDAGAPILATLEAAGEYGLAGVRPVSFRVAEPGDWGLILGLTLPAPHAVLDTGAGWMSWGEPWPAWAFPDAAIEEAWEVTWPDTR